MFDIPWSKESEPSTSEGNDKVNNIANQIPAHNAIE